MKELTFQQVLGASKPKGDSKLSPEVGSFAKALGSSLYHMDQLGSSLVAMAQCGDIPFSDGDIAYMAGLHHSGLNAVDTLSKFLEFKRDLAMLREVVKAAQEQAKEN